MIESRSPAFAGPNENIKAVLKQTAIKPSGLRRACGLVEQKNAEDSLQTALCMHIMKMMMRWRMAMRCGMRNGGLGEWGQRKDCKREGKTGD